LSQVPDVGWPVREAPAGAVPKTGAGGVAVSALRWNSSVAGGGSMSRHWK